MKQSGTARWHDANGRTTDAFNYDSLAAAPERLTVLNFETCDLARKEQFDGWYDFRGQVGTLTRPGPYSASFDAGMEEAKTSISSLSRCWVNSEATINRNGKFIDQPGCDIMAFQFQVRGGDATTEYEHGKLIRPGQIRVVDLAQPMHISSHGFENLTLAMPKSVMLERMPMLAEMHGEILEETPMVFLAWRFMRMAMESLDQLTIEEAEAVSHSALDLMETALLGYSDARRLESATTDAAVYKAVERYISENLRNPALSPDMIAHHVAVSRRKLYRACEPYGTPMELVKRARLNWAFEQIKLGRAQNITQLAFEAGFESRETFSRQFKRAFGYSAREFMMSARSGGV
ncbi:helix-turn-helix domain-containing protein [Kordiimonas lipolytica]|uniref:Helix-turn-helix domain-containing protein n=1 Tax=Kordiimonas lipolytica TaxID=1662421 RepID=A0ABV8U6T9_9PROT|nr:AraC family transcriptional regulator [Kordiimonas lipolytica]